MVGLLHHFVAKGQPLSRGEHGAVDFDAASPFSGKPAHHRGEGRLARTVVSHNRLDATRSELRVGDGEGGGGMS